MFSSLERFTVRLKIRLEYLGNRGPWAVLVLCFWHAEVRQSSSCVTFLAKTESYCQDARRCLLNSPPILVGMWSLRSTVVIYSVRRRECWRCQSQWTPCVILHSCCELLWTATHLSATQTVITVTTNSYCIYNLGKYSTAAQPQNINLSCRSSLDCHSPPGNVTANYSRINCLISIPINHHAEIPCC